MVSSTKYVFTSIAFCFVLCIPARTAITIDDEQAVVTVEQVRFFFNAHDPEKYQTILTHEPYNIASVIDQEDISLIPILKTIQNNIRLSGLIITPLDIAVQEKQEAWIRAILDHANSLTMQTIRSFKKDLAHAINEKKELNTDADWAYELFFDNRFMLHGLERKILSHQSHVLIDQPLNEKGDTGIILAARASRCDLVEQLTALGADPEKKNSAGENAQQFIKKEEDLLLK